MKTRTTLILLVLAVAIAAYVKFYESKRPGTDEARRTAQNVVQFQRDKIDGITIQNGDEKIELRRQDGKWRLEAPIKDQADGATIESLLFNLESWQKESTIAASELEKNRERLEEFGLARPQLRLKLQGKDAPPEILFGKDAAFEGKIYVRLGDAKDAFIAAQSVKTDISKKAEEFRDKNLTDLSTAQVNRIALKTAAGEMELQKNGESWSITKPLRARADEQRVTDLIAQVITAKVDRFVAEDSGDLKPYGLAEPRGIVTLYAEGAAEPKVLQIGSVPEQEKEKVHVRFLPRAAVYTLPRKLEEILNLKPDDLRDRHLVSLDPNILDRITIEGGGGKTVLARKEQAWTIASRNNQPANAAEVNRLIETLRAEQVARFVENVASDLPKYGLDKPQLQVTLSSFASENRAESTAGEQPFATIAFGKQEGEQLFARLTDEPFIVAVRRTLLDSIFSDPLQWQEPSVFSFKPDDIQRLIVAGEKDQILTRGANKEWTIAGGEVVNQTNVQSLLNTLGKLRAARWAGATVPVHGLDKPQLTITFSTSPDGKQVQKLQVGGPAGNGMWFARADGREGTFVLSNPDLSALRLPVSAPAAPPAPAPAGSPGGSPSPAAPGSPAATASPRSP